MAATIRLAPSGKEVETEAGDTVLASLERAGYALDNNCRAGACGECKTRVLSGEVDQGVVLDMALTEAERDAGYRLMCMAKPTSEVVEIDYGTADARPRLFPPRERVLSVVTERIRRTPSIVEIRLRPVGEPLRYWPGQYLMVGDERSGAPPRPYSIANAPRTDGEISLLVTRVPDGATSTWVHDRLDVGDRVTVAGPYGTFIGDPGTDGPVVCLAAGSGLAPILALTDAALRRGFRHPVTLVYSARSADDVFDDGLFAWWTAKHRRFDFRVTYTGDDAPPDAPFHGRIPEVLDEIVRPTAADDWIARSVYVAGSPGFVDDCVAAVRARGALDDHVFVERYHPQHLHPRDPATAPASTA